MDEQAVLSIFQDTGAIIEDSHIVYTSGLHGKMYLNKDAIYPHTGNISALCMDIANHFINRGIAVVIAPAVGGVILSQWTAYHLDIFTSKPFRVVGVYAEKDGEEFVIKRGYDYLVSRQRVLVVEDVLTTGGSARKVVEAVRKLKGEVMGVGALCNRGGVTVKDIGDVPELFSLIDINMESWPPEECPLCKKGVPININVGKGREFLANQKTS